jgi:LCP family protein required for cell wall assembly
MASDGGQRPQGSPEYKVYRSRRRLLDRFRTPDLARLRERTRSPRERKPRRLPSLRGGDEGRSWKRWLVIVAVGWFLLSVLIFIVSATIQSTKLPGSAKDALHGSPNMITSGQTILVIGTDVREKGSGEPGATTIGGPNCPNVAKCSNTRADTLMLIRAGGGSFRKLSIPRDSFAEIPGFGSGKINAAYADGGQDNGASLQIRAVEQFLGIGIDHVIIVDFGGFKDFINALGGVKVDIPEKICSKINGGGGRNGGFTLLLTKGTRTLHGQTALAYARTRENSCDPGYSDINRAAAQQRVLNGIKGRLTDPLRLPHNYIFGPWIAWNAPRAVISDMGALTMPQLVVAGVIGGGSNPDVLKPSGPGPGGSLIVPESERQRALHHLLHG